MNALRQQMGQGGLYNQAAQAGMGAYQQGVAGDASAASGQADLGQMYLDQAQGKGPSLAQNLMQQGLQQQQAQAASAMASQRGINPALAARMVGQQQQQAATAAVGQAGNARIQEQLAAQQGLGNVLAQRRQGAQGMAGLGQGMMGTGGGLAQSNMQNLAGLYNQENQNQFGVADRANNQMAQQNAWALANQQMKMQQSEGNSSRRAGIASDNAKADNATGGAILNAAGSVAALSDERAKTNIREGRGAIDNLLDSVGQHTYDYKDQANGQGTRIGPMAQELEHSSIGKNLVHTGPDGLKRVDAAGAALASLSASARLQDRLDAMGAPRMANGGVVGGTVDGGDAGDAQHIKTLGAHLLESHRALSSAHEHIARFASGGEVKPYKFAALDVRQNDSTYIPHSYGTSQPTQSTGEGMDSEGKKKVLKMAEGGVADLSDGGSVSQEFYRGGPVGMADGGEVPSPGFLQSFGNTLADGFKKFTGNLSDKFQNGPIGQMMHPGITQHAGVQLGDSTAGAPDLPAPPTSYVPSGSLMGGPRVMAGGGPVVPGRAKVEGDSEENDTVPALLSPGEVVLPRSVAKNPAKAAAFVQKLIEDGEVHPAVLNLRHGKRGKGGK